MKAFGFFLFLFFLIGTASFIYPIHFSKGSISSNPGTVPIRSNAMSLIVKGRKLKDVIDPSEDDLGQVSLEDYRPIDPAPSSKASLRPGPVQHGTPLMPYIPKPSPPPAPSRPKPVG